MRVHVCHGRYSDTQQRAERGRAEHVCRQRQVKPPPCPLSPPRWQCELSSVGGARDPYFKWIEVLGGVPVLPTCPLCACLVSL